MGAKEILLKICEANARDELENVLKEAFEEKDDVKLLKKRALLCEYCADVLQDIGYAEDTLDEILGVVAYKSLEYKMESFRHVLSTAQKNLVRSVFAHYEMKNEFFKDKNLDEVIEVVCEIEEDLKREDVDDTQKTALLEICKICKDAKEESKITGVSAAKKLHTLIVGKFALYANVLSSIKSKSLKEKLLKLYRAAEIANTFFELQEKIINFLQ